MSSRPAAAARRSSRKPLPRRRGLKRKTSHKSELNSEDKTEKYGCHSRVIPELWPKEQRTNKIHCSETSASNLALTCSDGTVLDSEPSSLLMSRSSVAEPRASVQDIHLGSGTEPKTNENHLTGFGDFGLTSGLQSVEFITEADVHLNIGSQAFENDFVTLSEDFVLFPETCQTPNSTHFEASLEYEWEYMKY